MVAAVQNRVAQTLAEQASIAKLQEMFRQTPPSTRTAAAESVCEAFGFVDHLGRLQISNCLTALRRLEGKGHIVLPLPRTAGGWKRTPRGTGEALPAPEHVPDRVDKIQALSLELVEGDEQMQLWNELLLREHPQGDRIITGRQLRYFICCEHGVLGAVGISAGALHLEARDQWIGWDWQLRKQYLEKVVCLSRLLIRSSVQCQNLGSKVLALLSRRLGADFEQRYGYAPWLLESFVDTTQHRGSCYQAANWVRVGRTKGRGRNDRERRATESIKDIYVYCLESDFRAHMALAHDAGAVPLAPGDGLDVQQWAHKEFGTAELGDRRLTKRLVDIANVKAISPTQPFIKCANGDHGQMQGYYRFIEHPDSDALNMQTILAGHKQRTIKRMSNESRVLCPQDTSVLEYSSLSSCTGLGKTGANGKGAKGKGMSLHTTLALTTNGLPLGIVDAECKARKFHQGTREERRKLPIERKETYCWLTSIITCEQIAEQLPRTRLVCVMDREGDIFELFNHWMRTKKVDLLVRGSKNRRSDVTDLLFNELKESSLRGHVQVDIPQRKNSKSRRVEPKAELEIRYKSVNLQVPKHCRIKDAEPISVWMIHAYEPSPSANTKRIEWYLISTEPVESLERAQQCIADYSRRWRIEEWHKVLKSGCKVEDVIADDAESLRRTTAINMVIAWRIMLMTLLGRGEEANHSPDMLFSELEIKVLGGVATQLKSAQPETLGQAVYLVARLGGYRGRSRDPAPGAIVLWRGYTELISMVRGAALFYDDSG